MSIHSLNSSGANIQGEGTKYATGLFQCPASTGTYSVTGLGFKPKLVQFTTQLSTSNYNGIGIGAMTETTQWSNSTMDRNSTGNNTSSYSNSNCIQHISETSGNYVLAAYSSMDTDGFTVNFSAVNTLFRIMWVAQA